MKQRVLGNTGIKVSEIGLGTWQLGARWGDPFDDKKAQDILQVATDLDINFFDTADVYNGGCSEKAIGEFIKDKKGKIFVTTKCGRQLNPHVASGYTKENIRVFINDSCARLGVEKLDLILLHCPPTEVYDKKEVWDELANLKNEGKISAYGVSIECVEEGLKAMKYGISAIEVIFNMFRLKPIEKLFVEAKKNNVGLIVRVPLASGLLTGRYTKTTSFGPNDHRTFNRNGESFDRGETFSGVDYDKGLMAVEQLKKLFNTNDLYVYALRYILMFDAVTTVIPGASNVKQVVENIEAANLPPLTDEQMAGVEKIYNEYIRESVHKYW